MLLALPPVLMPVSELPPVPRLPAPVFPTFAVLVDVVVPVEPRPEDARLLPLPTTTLRPPLPDRWADGERPSTGNRLERASSTRAPA